MSGSTTTAGTCPACNRPDTRRYQYDIGDVRICPECKLQWADKAENDVTGANDVTRVHEHYMDPASLDAQRYPPYRKFFSILHTLQPGSLRILDVGCGNGVFVGECLRRGHDAYGVEIDVSKEALMAPAVRARVDISAIEDLSTPARPYDVITFWDSFEHLREPFDVLSGLRHCMAPHTLVFVRVNNTYDIFNLVTAASLRLAPEFGRKLLNICFNLPQHYWNFSVRGMMLLAQRAGWRVLLHRVTDTPASRLTSNYLFRLAILTAYAVNRAIRGGKIGEYYLVSRSAGSGSS